jgi:hypothetical protein
MWMMDVHVVDHLNRIQKNPIQEEMVPHSNVNQTRKLVVFSAIPNVIQHIQAKDQFAGRTAEILFHLNVALSALLIILIVVLKLSRLSLLFWADQHFLFLVINHCII